MSAKEAHRKQRRPTIAGCAPRQRKEEARERQRAQHERLNLLLQLASGETCIRIAAEQRGLSPAELKQQLYGMPTPGKDR
jgi:ribosome-binding protein aMBF1 (putative translation factor)